MLVIKPSCEHCNHPLPADSTQVMICSFECTFCATCSTDYFKGICPNCLGDLQSRPIRPSTDLKSGNFLGQYPSSSAIVYAPKDVAKHQHLLKEYNLISWRVVYEY